MSKLRILAAEAAVAVALWLGFLAWYHATNGGLLNDAQNIAVDIGSAQVLVLSLVVVWASGRRAYTDQQKRNRTWISLIIVLFGLLVLVAGLLAAARERADPCLDPRITCSQTAASGALFRAAVDTAIAYVGIAVSIISFSALVSIRLNRVAG
jgi:uncharacterized iron-regulated membrane protein